MSLKMSSQNECNTQKYDPDSEGQYLYEVIFFNKNKFQQKISKKMQGVQYFRWSNLLFGLQTTWLGTE